MTREGRLRVAVVGVGAVGRRAADHLRSGTDPADVVLVHHDRRGAVADIGGDVDVVIVTAPVDARPGVEAALERGAHVVVTGDHPTQIRRLLTLDSEARERGLTVAVGAAMAPGLSCVLARHAGAGLDRVSEIHVASAGTGGPACARRHHRALTSVAVDWEQGWRRRPGGSGRELVWFPEPVGGADCYRASRPDPALLVPAFPGVRRVTARLEATRRDRMTSWLPMLRPPHPEGLVGAVRVEVRGWQSGVAQTVVVGASAPPAQAAGTVAAVVALRAGAGALARPGVAGLAELVADPDAFLADVARRGIRTTVFEGAMGPVRSALDTL
ncbi:MAG: hypothetical protein ACRDZY_06145, partial [Acidimicrobiales bacterium]